MTSDAVGHDVETTMAARDEEGGRLRRTQRVARLDVRSDCAPSGGRSSGAAEGAEASGGCGRGLSRRRRHGCGFRCGRSSQRIGGAGTQCRDGAGDDE
eukprot:3942028-Pleurochrysis_carterae.AAC.1